MDTEKKKEIMRENFAGIADRKFLKWLERRPQRGTTEHILEDYSTTACS